MIPRESKSWALELPYIVLLFGIVAWRYAPLLTGEVYKTLHPDALYLYMPVFSEISRIFSAGDFPYRLPTHLAGIPLYNATHFTVLYPFYFFNWNLYQTPLDCVVQINRVIGFHLVLLALNSYVMLRIMGRGRYASLMGGGLTACGATVIVLASWVNIIAPLSWIPLALAGLHLILSSPHTKPGVALAASALAMVCLASPAQEAIYALYLILGMCLCKGLELLRRFSALEAGRMGVAVLSTGMAAFCLTAPVVIATLTAMPDMLRFTGSHDPVTGFQALPLPAILEGQIAPLELLKGLVQPMNRLPVTGDPYWGVIPVGLACLAFRQHRAVWLQPFLFFTLYGLYSATGEHLGAAAINHHLPLLSKIREADRHLVFTAISLPVLAAVGLEYLSSVLSGIFQRTWSKGPVIAVAAALLLLVFYPGRNDALWAAFPLNQTSYKGVDLYAAEKNQAALNVLAQLKGFPEWENYRFVFHTRTLAPVFWAMNGAYYGLRGLESFFQPLPKEQFFDLNGKETLLPYLQLLGGRYYIWEKGAGRAPDDFIKLRSFEDVELYEARKAWPHCFFTETVTGVYTDREDFWRKIASHEMSKPPLYVESKQLPTLEARLHWDEDIQPRFSITTLARSPNKFAFRASSNRTAVLVLNEYHGPDWQARVDGNPSQTIKVNLNQIGLLLEKGDHEVEFQYSPVLFRRLLAFSGTCWVFWLIGMIIGYAGTKR